MRIQGEVVACMEKIKRDLLRDERFNLVHKHLRMLSTVVTDVRASRRRTVEGEYKPRTQDLAMMPEVRQLVDAPASDVIVEKSAFEELGLKLPGLEERWLHERRADLRRALANSNYGGAADGVDPLELARTLFRCKECDTHMQYPAALAHDCLAVPVEIMFAPPDKETPFEDYLQWVVDMFHVMPWDAAKIEASLSMYTLEYLVKTCQEGPRATTRKDMDDASIRLVDDSDPDGSVM